MIRTSEKPNSGTKKLLCDLLNSTTFVDHKKKRSIKTCILVGCLNTNFFPGVGGGNLNELIFKILNARGELPRGMLKFRIDRPITGWARTLSLIKKWFKWNRAVILSLYFKSEKKHSPHCLTWLLLRTIHSARVIRICCQNLKRLFTALT